MKKRLLVLGLVLVIIYVGWQRRGLVKENGLKRLRVGEEIVVVEIVDTPETRAQGLSGRESLGENEGMLFVFDEFKIYSFWMKEMKFDLDFAWIMEGEVVGLAEQVLAPKVGESPVVVRPSQPIEMVLEVNSGFLNKKGVKIGDRVEFVR